MKDCFMGCPNLKGIWKLLREYSLGSLKATLCMNLEYICKLLYLDFGRERRGRNLSITILSNITNVYTPFHPGLVFSNQKNW